MGVEGYPEEEIETGEQYMKSYLGDNWYRVTKWVDKEDDKFVALEKEPIEKHEVPEKWRPDEEVEE